MQEVSLPLSLVFLPKSQGAGRHLCIGLVGTVCSPDHARFSAGRGACVSRSPRIHQSDAHPGAQQVKCGPSTEYSCTHNHNMTFALSVCLHLPSRFWGGQRISSDGRAKHCCPYKHSLTMSAKP